jgi:hypothetical protein
VSFGRDESGRTANRGAGGLVTALIGADLRAYRHVAQARGLIIGVPLILAAGLGGGLSPAAVLAAVAVVLVGEAVAGLAKQRRGTLTTGAPEEGP